MWGCLIIQLHASIWGGYFTDRNHLSSVQTSEGPKWLLNVWNWKINKRVCSLTWHEDQHRLLEAIISTEVSVEQPILWWNLNLSMASTPSFLYTSLNLLRWEIPLRPDWGTEGQPLPSLDQQLLPNLQILWGHQNLLQKPAVNYYLGNWSTFFLAGRMHRFPLANMRWCFIVYAELHVHEDVYKGATPTAKLNILCLKLPTAINLWCEASFLRTLSPHLVHPRLTIAGTLFSGRLLHWAGEYPLFFFFFFEREEYPGLLICYISPVKA